MAATARSAPRRVPPEQALPEPALGLSGVTGGTVGAAAVGAATGGAAAAAAVQAGMPVLQAGAESVEAVLDSFRRFFVLLRMRQDSWLIQRARPRLPQQDVLDLIALETSYQAEFERRVRERVQRDATRAFQLPEADRKKALVGLMRREQTYARQRSEAMAVRALAAIDRVALRIESPTGAFWELDPTAKAHTAGCRILAGHVFPWVILDAVFPPFGHAGCRCRLRERRSGERVLSVVKARLLVARAKAAEEVEHGH